MKLKSLLALLFAAVIIVLGAMLPSIVGSRQDAANDGQVLFASVSDIQLEFTDNDRTMRETIYILAKLRDSVEIPEDLASLKKANVARITNAVIEKYQEAGLLTQEGSFNVVNSVPMLAYGSGEGMTNVFWYVNCMNVQMEEYFTVVIDDRTGTVCSVEYSSVDREYVRQDMGYVLQNFSDIYLSGLGDAFYEFDSQEILDGAESPVDGSYLASTIEWFDADYGEATITFFVNTTGFYTYIS